MTRRDFFESIAQALLISGGMALGAWAGVREALPRHRSWEELKLELPDDEVAHLYERLRQVREERDLAR